MKIFITYAFSGAMTNILSVTDKHDIVVIWVLFAGQVVLIEFDVLVAIKSYLSVVISIEVDWWVPVFVSEAIWTKRVMNHSLRSNKALVR